jgi:hypothetical protein
MEVRARQNTRKDYQERRNPDFGLASNPLASKVKVA